MANISWIESGRTELNRILRSRILEWSCHMEAMIKDRHCPITCMHLDFCFRRSTAAAKQPVHCRTRTTANRSSLYCTTSSILAKPLAGRASSLFLFCNTIREFRASAAMALDCLQSHHVTEHEQTRWTYSAMDIPVNGHALKLCLALH